ncbi:MAG TPA: 4a-hydroxytetrahydrobiopterin dehydratase [archaeon]|nr:4a-hydroxytetrahydrobiopterin dehydratase [archaeon]
MTAPISETEAEKRLADINKHATKGLWKLHSGKLVKKYEFKDFNESMKFVNAVAELAEKEGHHPFIAISYNEVTLELITHDIGGLSDKDFILAEKIDRTL